MSRCSPPACKEVRPDFPLMRSHSRCETVCSPPQIRHSFSETAWASSEHPRLALPQTVYDARPSPRPAWLGGTPPKPAQNPPGAREQAGRPGGAGGQAQGSAGTSKSEKRSQALRAEGNACFSKGEFQNSMELYTKALNALREEGVTSGEEMAMIYSNLSAAAGKLVSGAKTLRKSL